MQLTDLQYSVFSILGLLRDDTIYENDDVKEALTRIPEKMYNDRVFRVKRALDLSMKQQVLPKDQWTQYEEVGVQLVVFIIYVVNKNNLKSNQLMQRNRLRHDLHR
jgi:ubiquinol-cytochrome c reductase subunit 7